MRQMLHGGDVLDTEPPLVDEDTAVADFALLDVNPTSSTFDHAVSPRDYLGQVSAWYLGHADSL